MPVDGNDPSPPVGEDNWLAYIDEARRTADDLEKRVGVIELYKQAINAEPGSLKIWLAYCEYFHSLYVACQAPEPPPSWTADEVLMGREIFSLHQDLDLWQSAYEDIRLRIGDSHILWDRWVEVEMEQLRRTQTREGIERITLLYRDRLRTPHITWDETSQRFSSFLSEYNKDNWETVMKEVTQNAQEAKAVVDARQRFEFPLQKAAREGNVEEERRIMREYLTFEIARSKKEESSSAVPRCRSLFSRALAGIFAQDDSVWLDFIAYLSSNLSPTQPVSNLLSPLQKAVAHCPWSGPLWSRYILAAEEAALSFDDIEQVKHAATNNSQLYRDGLASLLDMYVAWCGYLKRFAMNPNASEEAVDVADVGLPAALESVEVLGSRLYGSEFQGDPDFRLERIYIQYLTEKKGDIEGARARWELLARKPLYADKYDFWRAYYLWEMQIFYMTGQPSASGKSGTAASPDKATAVLANAVYRKTLDWPERAIGVYLQHCNDYDPPHMIRRARDNIHKIRIVVAKRREREAAEAAEAYAYQAQAQAEAEASTAKAEAAAAAAAETHAAPESPSGTKRKRADTQGEDETASKRPRASEDTSEVPDAPKPKNGETDEGGPKRDREHTSVLITNLPADVTQTAIKKYLKDFGHIQNMTLVKGPESSTALIEFEDIGDAEDCVKFRDNKYFGESQIRVESGAGLTLFVTNYPPTANEEYMRNLFKDCGDILSIRWPSLKYNTRRRFCYISFRDREAAAKATRMAGKTLEGKFRLEVKYSDPSRRKKREGALSERREVYVSNLDGTLREGDLRDVFGKYGPVVRVSMVDSRDKEKGGGFSNAFVEFEKPVHAAEAVAELNNTKLRSRVLSVGLALPRAKVVAKVVNPDAPSGGKQPPSAAAGEGEGVPPPKAGGAPSPPPGDVYVSPIPPAAGVHLPPIDAVLAQPEEEPMPDVEPGPAAVMAQQEVGPMPALSPPTTYDHSAEIRKKVAIMNLPDTVNDSRVMELAKTIGGVEKLVLQPRKGSAVVTFVDEATAGRAMLGLNGRVWEGVELTTGGMEDLAKYMGRTQAEGKGHDKGGKGKERLEVKVKGKGNGNGNGLGGLAPVNVRRPVLGGKGGRGAAKRGLGGPVVRAGPHPSSGGGGEGGKKSNADFKAMFLGGGAASAKEGGKNGGENGDA
ncbi:related to PRP24 - pre-mRNA splicing factor [Cephalotrichum gorgonifer]|uniref:U4/U6 snRNA-associated-splicing factor PRP24 n=1 Tax=Cephalotrichum gorgonifer TaxID=2041049 RepID=A0AAE8N8N9_9PEZI|nr:related to PRP24 - pre-mRNA splicing factor [Cephalotrichum gorgonifer]